MRDFIKARLRRNAAYKKLFLGPFGQLKPEAELVLTDLVRFAHLFEDHAPEAGLLGLLEGRRQVLRRLWKQLKLNERDILKLSGEQNETF